MLPKINCGISLHFLTLTQLLQQISPGVKDPSDTRQSQDPRLRPLLLGSVTRVVDEDVSTP